MPDLEHLRSGSSKYALVLNGNDCGNIIPLAVDIAAVGSKFCIVNGNCPADNQIRSFRFAAVGNIQDTVTADINSDLGMPIQKRTASGHIQSMGSRIFLLVILAADPYPLCRYFCTVRHGYIRYIGRCIVRPADNEFRINVSFISVQTDIRICSKQNGSFFQREIRIFVIGSNFSGKSGRSILRSAEDIELAITG